MAKYSKAIGATVGAAALWLAAFGMGDGLTLLGLSPEAWTTMLTGLGGAFGAYIAPKNA